MSWICFRWKWYHRARSTRGSSYSRERQGVHACMFELNMDFVWKANFQNEASHWLSTHLAQGAKGRLRSKVDMPMYNCRWDRLVNIRLPMSSSDLIWPLNHLSWPRPWSVCSSGRSRLPYFELPIRATRGLWQCRWILGKRASRAGVWIEWHCVWVNEQQGRG